MTYGAYVMFGPPHRPWALLPAPHPNRNVVPTLLLLRQQRDDVVVDSSGLRQRRVDVAVQVRVRRLRSSAQACPVRPCGTATPSRSASSTTAPVMQPASRRLPASRSCSMEVL